MIKIKVEQNAKAATQDVAKLIENVKYEMCKRGSFLGI